MKISGTADLPLHGGHVPAWLMSRMKSMASAIAKVIVEDYGRRELLKRLSDPYWFQSNHLDAFSDLIGIPAG